MIKVNLTLISIKLLFILVFIYLIYLLNVPKSYHINKPKIANLRYNSIYNSINSSLNNSNDNKIQLNDKKRL